MQGEADKRATYAPPLPFMRHHPPGVPQGVTLLTPATPGTPPLPSVMCTGPLGFMKFVWHAVPLPHIGYIDCVEHGKTRKEYATESSQSVSREVISRVRIAVLER